MKIDITHTARLSNLSLTNSEKKNIKNQLEETLVFIESLNEVDTKNIKPSSQVTGLENITREDQTSPSLTQQKALKNSKSTYNGFFKVKGVLENE